MEIKLLKKCVDSFCPLILSEFGVCLKVMMIDQIDYMHFERWTVKLLVTLEMQKKNSCTNRKTQPILLTYGTTEGLISSY